MVTISDIEGLTPNFPVRIIGVKSIGDHGRVALAIAVYNTVMYGIGYLDSMDNELEFGYAHNRNVHELHAHARIPLGELLTTKLTFKWEWRHTVSLEEWQANPNFDRPPQLEEKQKMLPPPR